MTYFAGLDVSVKEIAVAIPTTERSRRLSGSGYAPQQYQVPNVRNGVNSGASHQRQPAAHIRFSPKA